MIPLRARWIASRHRTLVGRPLSSRRIGVGPGLPLLFLGILAVIALALTLNPGSGIALTVGILVVVALLLLLGYLVVADPRLVVCEHGLIIGRLIPGLPLSPTYVIAAREIDPRTVCVVSSGPRAARQVGLPSFFFQFFAYPGGFGVPAVMFNGPWGADVMAMRDDRPRGVTAKSLYSFAHRRSTVIATEILHAIGRAGGLPRQFQPANSLQPIAVTGRREDAVRQIPGAWPPDTRR